jgi:uncharacterized protein YfaS (alpha-2-macroglobulin family)
MQALVKYTDKDGYVITDGDSVSAGERVYGEIILRPLAGELKNIVVALPLAGGLEIENPNLVDVRESVEDTDYNYDYYGQVYQTSRTELRDDRLLLFVDYAAREFKWKFVMRAITPGKFTLPPIAAEGMYSPGTRSVGETAVIVIK